jgi:hypothetical protein
MVDVSYCRDRADHLRQLADLTWQHDLEVSLRLLAQDYDETAEDLEIGASGSATPSFSPRANGPDRAGPAFTFQ